MKKYMNQLLIIFLLVITLGVFNRSIEANAATTIKKVVNGTALEKLEPSEKVYFESDQYIYYSNGDNLRKLNKTTKKTANVKTSADYQISPISCYKNILYLEYINYDNGSSSVYSYNVDTKEFIAIAKGGKVLNSVINGRYISFISKSLWRNNGSKKLNLYIIDRVTGKRTLIREGVGDALEEVYECSLNPASSRFSQIKKGTVYCRYNETTKIWSFYQYSYTTKEVKRVGIIRSASAIRGIYIWNKDTVVVSFEDNDGNQKYKHCTIDL